MEVVINLQHLADMQSLMSGLIVALIAAFTWKA